VGLLQLAKAIAIAVLLGRIILGGTPMGPMTNCRQCGGQISIHAEMCPHCGAPFLYARGSVLFWVVLGAVLSVFAFIVWFAISNGDIPMFK
jgi:hypothetical protein